ncbi:shTK domain protein [Teladorsagia circumcincta]|uniref:ShTK domain protein n=1 Tax=Teladorsagia circumcincta TaxID=45464 RepID=A0A2G9TMK2_TELCI|nr:shTK domain protein [Teladorsagia circumcincta]
MQLFGLVLLLIAVVSAKFLDTSLHGSDFEPIPLEELYPDEPVPQRPVMPAPLPRPSPSVVSKCMDEPNCSIYVRIGICKLTSESIKRKCAKSCKLC